VKYERLRLVVRKLNEVLRERRYQRSRRQLTELMEVVETLTWRVGQQVGSAAEFTWVRFGTREEYNRYNAFKRSKICSCGDPTELGYVHRVGKPCWQPAKDQEP
jgi:hypothetical protein